MTPIGSSPIIPILTVGPTGPTGATGPTGVAGYDGITPGARGTTGATGVHIVSGDNTSGRNLTLTLSDGTTLVVENFIGPTGEIGSAVGTTGYGVVGLLKEVSAGLTFWFKGLSGTNGITLSGDDDLVWITGNKISKEANIPGITTGANRLLYLSGNDAVGYSGLTFDGSKGIDFDNTITVDIEENVLVIPEINFNETVGITGAPCDGTCPGGTAGNGSGIQLEVRHGSVIKVHTPTGIAGFTGEFVDSETVGFTLILDGNYLWDWPTNVYFDSDNATISCGEDIINFISNDGGVRWNATVTSIGYGGNIEWCNGVATLGSCCYVDAYGKKQCVEYITELACNENYGLTGSGWSSASSCADNCGFTAEGICCSQGGNWGDFAGVGLCIEGTGVAECNYFGGTFLDYFYYEDDEYGNLVELDVPTPITCLIGNESEDIEWSAPNAEACCLTDTPGDCRIAVDESWCVGANGTPLDEDTCLFASSCYEDPTPPYSGVCCLINGSTINTLSDGDENSSSICENDYNGIYFGNQTRADLGWGQLCGDLRSQSIIDSALCSSSCNDPSSCCKNGVCIGDSVGSTSIGSISPKVCKYVHGGNSLDGFLCGEIDCCNYTSIYGACCYTDIQQCTEEYGYQCVSAGGVFMGPGTNCDEDVCCFFDEVGVCCLNADACDCCGGVLSGACSCVTGCSIQTEHDCSANSDYCVYLGDDTVCSGDAYGACCTQEGGWQCNDRSITECANNSGTLLLDTCDNIGNGPGCASTMMGACCMGTTCRGNKTPEQCDFLGGTWMGHQTLCSEVDCDYGACICMNGCFLATGTNPCPTGCVYLDGQPCPPESSTFGACCKSVYDPEHQPEPDYVRKCYPHVPIGNCQGVAGDGMPDIFMPMHHNNPECNPDNAEFCQHITGACCNPQTPYDCEEYNDFEDGTCGNHPEVSRIYMGQGTVCAEYNCATVGNPPGACCWHGDDFSTCSEMNQTDCENRSGPDDGHGEWHGAFTTCETITCGGGPQPLLPGCSSVEANTCCTQDSGDGTGKKCIRDSQCEANGGKEWNTNLACRSKCGVCCNANVCTDPDDNNPQTTCTNEGGVWHSCFECSEISCNTIGACCQLGACNESTQEDCTFGIWLGANTTCDGDGEICNTPSACCYNDGGVDVCETMIPSVCNNNSGTWVDADCTSNPCNLPTGACCSDDDTSICTTETEANCNSYNGTYQDDGTNCSPDPCNNVACCQGTSCTDMTASECNALGGEPQAAGSDCATTDCELPIGVCCHDCTVGSCCLANKCQSYPNGLDCVAAGGVWYTGGNTECQNDCTCCTPDATSGTCDDVGDDFRQGGYCIDCNAEEGACCYSDGNCEPKIEPDCDDGDWHGEGSQCGDVTCPILEGACCESGGLCSGPVTEANCSGTYQGDGSECDEYSCLPKGACCVDNSCEVISDAECQARQGTYKGHATNCSGSPTDNICGYGICCKDYDDEDVSITCPYQSHENGYGCCHEYVLENDCIGVGVWNKCEDNGNCDGVCTESNATCAGACCFGCAPPYGPPCDGCTPLADDVCSSSDGIFMGVGTDCTGHPAAGICNSTVVCCFTNEVDGYECTRDNCCDDMQGYECIELGGIIQSFDGSASCDGGIGPCGDFADPIRACCLGIDGDYQCLQTTQSVCSSYNNSTWYKPVWMGGEFELNCDDVPGFNPCFPTEDVACCHDGICEMVSPETCLFTYRGVMRNGLCQQNDCSRQACCMGDNSCQFITTSECNSKGGEPQGNDAKCYEVSCGGNCKPLDIMFLLNASDTMAGVNCDKHWGLQYNPHINQGGHHSFAGGGGSPSDECCCNGDLDCPGLTGLPFCTTVAGGQEALYCGACCFGELCVEKTLSQCYDQGGQHKGVGVGCTESECEDIWSCCNNFTPGNDAGAYINCSCNWGDGDPGYWDGDDGYCPFQGNCDWMDPNIPNPTPLRMGQDAIKKIIDNATPSDKIGFATFGSGFRTYANDFNGFDYLITQDPLGKPNGTCTTWDCIYEPDQVGTPLNNSGSPSKWCTRGDYTQYSPMSFNREHLSYRINNVVPYGYTGLLWATSSDVIKEFELHGRPSEDVQRVLIIITDGSDGDWALSSSLFIDELKDEMGVEIFVIAIAQYDEEGNPRIGDGMPMQYNESNPSPTQTADWGIHYDDWYSNNTLQYCNYPRCGFGEGCCANTCINDIPTCWGANCCLGRPDGIDEFGDGEIEDYEIGKCPWPGWSKHNCRGHYMKTLASDFNHYYEVENYEEVLDKIRSINSKFCDTGTRCCKNLNKPMCSQMGGDWKPGYCHNEGSLCTNFGTKACGTSSLCGTELYVGACCIQGSLDSVCENNMTLESCTEIGGDFRGLGSFCESEDCGDTGHNNGACCFINNSGNGECELRSATRCVTQGGIWDGRPTCDGVHCCDEVGNPSGACCYWNASDESINCSYEPDCICEQIGGIFAGENTTCSDTECNDLYHGGCCDSSGDCEDKLFDDCDGTWRGLPCDEFCCDDADIGMCCIGQNCFAYSKCVCQNNGGTWGGAGTACQQYSCIEGINDEVSKYVELPDGRCAWIMCSLNNCPYPDCETEE
jgi:hypothetical protein